MATNIPTNQVWHALTAEEAIAALDANPELGLESWQISDRRTAYGRNELSSKAGRTKLSIFVDQFTNIMLLMLMGVAVVSAVLDLRVGNFPKDAVAIAAIVILNGILGYVQESRAEDSLAALKCMAAPNVRVLREGKVAEILSAELVLGDIVFVDAGMQIAADGRLLEAANLKVREGALTGESQGVTKIADQVFGEDESLGDRRNMVFQGTEVLQGRGMMVVTATGMQTELGKIANLLQDVELEETPLQKRMTELSEALVIASLLLVALVIGVGLWRQGDFVKLLNTSLSMAVAAVPEGLPAVITVTLALGTQRMVKRKVLIRKLPAVETLGSVTTICSDKTGTLTQNKMVAESVFTANYAAQISGTGYEPIGDFAIARVAGDMIASNLSVYQCSELQLLLAASAICNDAYLQKNASSYQGTRGLSPSPVNVDSSQWKIIGDPTEGALLTLAGKANLWQSQFNKYFTRVAEIPFTSERKLMSAIAAIQSMDAEDTPESVRMIASLLPDAPYFLFCKGSPELVLERCDRVQMDKQISSITISQRSAINLQNTLLATKGMRVLGLAYLPLNKIPTEAELLNMENKLVWLGLVGIRDALRSEAAVAVQISRHAGIHTIMITGDHQLTAQAIARDLNIFSPENDKVLTGQEIELMDDDELTEIARQTAVYARVSPEHKLRIVQALQRRGEVVAMTGDGVNDAPALKQANIGIAMGITGTDVSKEASDMILLDDNYATIVAATEEGRTVYANIRRFIKYILGSNVGEVIAIASTPFLGFGAVPLTPLQILWMNLVTDGVPALALAVEPAEADVMERPPFNPQENIFSRGLGWYILRIGVVFGLQTIALMQIAYNSGNPSWQEHWKTITFTTLCIAQMGHALSCRSESKLLIELNPISNPYLLVSVIFTTILQLSLLYVPSLRQFFGTDALTASELGLCFGFSMLLVLWTESEKIFSRLWAQRRVTKSSIKSQI
ncbi:cation-translocating P-type ATPase [Pseudanabaena sp. FACHB-1998]|uniref:cation-translocating P-type ATPase n=1 Tax=Pseudanabaena sp. FACHB-1998 TaxID=2692858 RepID=UPI001681672A|nr:cation-translocating P-type ATPase [Pseudanabaena sp. FACHB-1998]MBD2176128.1 cation-translocating P-type ATPase [Pseudanabaena sp. FACHB-1998]